MADATMASIKTLRIHTIQLAHAAREITLWCFDQQVVMIIHQAVGMTTPIHVFYRARQYRQKQGPVIVVQKDGLAGIAASSDMIKCAGIFNTQGP